MAAMFWGPNPFRTGERSSPKTASRRQWRAVVGEETSGRSGVLSMAGDAVTNTIIVPRSGRTGSTFTGSPRSSPRRPLSFWSCLPGPSKKKEKRERDPPPEGEPDGPPHPPAQRGLSERGPASRKPRSVSPINHTEGPEISPLPSAVPRVFFLIFSRVPPNIERRLSIGSKIEKGNGRGREGSENGTTEAPMGGGTLSLRGDLRVVCRCDPRRRPHAPYRSGQPLRLPDFRL